MDIFTVPAVSAVAASLGVISHLGYFIHGEHHMSAVRLFVLLLLSPLLVFGAFVQLNHRPDATYLTAAKLTLATNTSYLTALTLSILTYRAFFHPLRNFPGPFSAKLSKITHVFRIAKDSNNYMQADQLHKQYGEVVRVGPNELTIIHPEAVPVLLGPGSKSSKSAWYDVVGLPNVSLHLNRDKSVHDRRRKVWDRGFSAKALRDYEGRVTGYADQLIDQLTPMSGKPVNASLWLNFYSFDVMGDLAFGKSFDMLKSGEKHFALKLLQEGMKPLGIITPIPWIIPIIQSIPGAGAGMKVFAKWCNEQVSARQKNTPEVPDIMSWLIDAKSQGDDWVYQDPRWLHGDARLIVVAGSDTTASTLTYIFYHLAANPSVVAKLRQELVSINYQAGSKSEVRDIQDCKYLNGIINEGLRLHPPVPGGVLRQTPPEGMMIGPHFIPGNVIISAPTWTMGRLESCFVRPEQFLPERWADKPELVKNKAVFAPFSSGRYSCIGKQLALMELRTVVVRIISQFDVKFAPGEDGSGIMERARDVFTLDVPELKLVFTKR